MPLTLASGIGKTNKPPAGSQEFCNVHLAPGLLEKPDCCNSETCEDAAERWLVRDSRKPAFKFGPLSRAIRLDELSASGQTRAMLPDLSPPTCYWLLIRM